MRVHDKKTLSQIYASLKKRRGKSKYLLTVCLKLYNKENETIHALIVYVRDRHNKKKWIELISTDMNLKEEIIQLYGKRWDIEVLPKFYFKASRVLQSKMMVKTAL